MNLHYKNIGLAVLLFAALLVLWPNLVHELLHYAALRLQGVEGRIAFDWSIPAHPSTTREGQIASLGGGLLFLLLPSLVSLVIIGVLLFLVRPNAWLHGVLGTYLVFDLLINVRGYAAPYSDFRFLQALPLPVTWMIVVPIALIGLAVLWKATPAMEGVWMEGDDGKTVL